MRGELGDDRREKRRSAQQHFKRNQPELKRLSDNGIAAMSLGYAKGVRAVGTARKIAELACPDKPDAAAAAGTPASAMRRL
jgi:hypothetical protein